MTEPTIPDPPPVDWAAELDLPPALVDRIEGVLARSGRTIDAVLGPYHTPSATPPARTPFGTILGVKIAAGTQTCRFCGGPLAERGPAVAFVVACARPCPDAERLAAEHYIRLIPAAPRAAGGGTE